MKKSTACLLSLFYVSLIAGCATRGAFVYIPQTEYSAPRRLPHRVAVKSFRDRRGNRNRDYTLMQLIPLWPWGEVKYDRPEAGTDFINQVSYLFRPSEDFARALIDDLRAAGMFEEVFYTEREIPADADLIVDGTIDSTYYNGKTLSYGLSFAAPNIWLLGVPAGKSTNEVKLSMRLIGARDGKVLWEKAYSKETSHVGGMYYNLYVYCSGYPEMIREINRDAIKSIEEALANNYLELESEQE